MIRNIDSFAVVATQEPCATVARNRMSDVSLIATLLFFASAVSCIVLAGFLSHVMLRRVSVELPGSLRRDYFRSSEKNAKAARRNRRIYAAATRRVRPRFLILISIASTIACAWELGFFDFILRK